MLCRMYAKFGTISFDSVIPILQKRFRQHIKHYLNRVFCFSPSEKNIVYLYAFIFLMHSTN
jgi:hypothetical protein